MSRYFIENKRQFLSGSFYSSGRTLIN